jgi:hypothetical protein
LGVTDPEPHSANVNGGAVDPELKCPERQACTEEQNAVHELPDLLEGQRRVPVSADDARTAADIQRWSQRRPSTQVCMDCCTERKERIRCRSPSRRASMRLSQLHGSFFFDNFNRGIAPPT